MINFVDRVLDYLSGVSPSRNEILESKKSYPTLTKSPIVLEPKTTEMIKAHSIVGSIESYGRNTKYFQLVDWLKSNETVIANNAMNDSNHMKNHNIALRPTYPGAAMAIGPGCFGSLKSGDPVYVLGDTHGDFESLVAIFDTILDASAKRFDLKPTIYLLGDILDRNTETCLYEMLFILAIMQRILPADFSQYNNIQLGIVKGDHDVAMQYNESLKTFTSLVTPSDFVSWYSNRVNTSSNPAQASLIGFAWIKLMEECPAMAFLSDSGTFLSHGGVPRSDVQEAIKSGIPYAAQSENAADDAIWCRMVDVKNKMLNRGTKTSEIGFQEFDSFNKEVFFGQIKKFVFGHQHPSRGYLRFNKFFSGYDVLCISSFRNDYAMSGPTIPYFCKITRQDIHVYSLSPAAYVVKLEEHS